MDKRILVLASEKVDRGIGWRIGAVLIGGFVISLTIFGPYFLSGVPDSFNPRGFFNLANVVIVTGFIVGYLLRVYYDTYEPVQCILTDEGVEIGKRFFSYEGLDGFFLEIDKDKTHINNIVFVKNDGMFIFTLIDSIDEENFKDFINTLKAHTNYLDEYQPSLFWSIIRKCKL